MPACLCGVDRLNALDVDAVVVAYDWTYEPPRDLHALLQPFSRLRHPVWGVLGNHDTGAPGPPLAQALRQALQDHGVQVLDGRRMQAQGWDVVGLSDLWGGEPRGEMARLLPPGTPSAPRLVLAHQPDTAALLAAGSWQQAAPAWWSAATRTAARSCCPGSRASWCCRA
jgi:hypothetical protein